MLPYNTVQNDKTSKHSKHLPSAHNAGNRVGRRRWVSEVVQDGLFADIETKRLPTSSNTWALTANDEDTEPSLSYPDGFADTPTIDWLAFTIHPKRLALEPGSSPVDPSDEILFLKNYLADYFGGGQTLPYGLLHYQCSASVLGTGRVCWHPERPEMGVHVILKSDSLSVYAKVGQKTIYDFLYDMLDLGAKFSRADIALDSDVVTMATVIDAHELDKTITKAQGSQKIRDYKSGGETLYIGSRTGRRFVRIYDKAAQQGVGGVWTRCEVELKKEHAQTAIEYIVAGHDAREILLSSVDFRELDNSETKRRTRCDWWQAWVQVTARLRFPVKKKLAEVTQAMAWVMHQVTPTLAFLSMYMGNTYWLDNLIADAAKRVPGWRYDLLPASG